LYRVAIHCGSDRELLPQGFAAVVSRWVEEGCPGGTRPEAAAILSLLDVAQSPDDLAIPSFRTHPLKGDLAGHWSIWVNGNWRITFRFIEIDVELVDYQDSH
jgi:proteic killer suppression protein